MPVPSKKHPPKNATSQNSPAFCTYGGTSHEYKNSVNPTAMIAVAISKSLIENCGIHSIIDSRASYDKLEGMPKFSIKDLFVSILLISLGAAMLSVMIR